MCDPQWCNGCGEELIHRDHRKGDESASALGQIVWCEGPKKLIFVDADALSLKLLKSGKALLRILEQKNPDHVLKWGQEKVLRKLDAVIAHACTCPDAADLQLDPESGVYFVRGHVAADDSPSGVAFDGPQTIERLRDGEERTVTTHEEFFRFVDPQDGERHNRRRGRGFRTPDRKSA